MARPLWRSDTRVGACYALPRAAPACLLSSTVGPLCRGGKAREHALARALAVWLAVTSLHAGIRAFLEAPAGTSAAPGSLADVSGDARMLKVIRRILSNTGNFSSADVFQGLQQLSQLRARVSRLPCAGPRLALGSKGMPGTELLRASSLARRDDPGCRSLPRGWPRRSALAVAPGSRASSFLGRSALRGHWLDVPLAISLQCRAELAKTDVLVVPTSAYNYTVQEILVGGRTGQGLLLLLLLRGRPLPAPTC